MSSPFTTYTLEQLRSRTSEKWLHYDPEVLPMWVAEMDASLAPAVVEAVSQAMASGDTGYASGHAYGDAFVDYAQRHWNLDLDVNNIVGVIDVIRGLVDVIVRITDPGDPVIITPPVYYPFALLIEKSGRTIVNAPLTSAGRLDPDQLERAFREASTMGKNAVVLLSNPHNPTGIVHTREELTELAQLAQKYGVRIVSDEIHAPLVMPGFEFVSILHIPEAPDAVVVTSASKSYNLAGLKAALVVTHDASHKLIDELSQPMVEGPTHLGNIAHTAALRSGDSWLAETVAAIDVNRHLLTELVAKYLPGALYQPVEATYLGWVDCRPLGLGDNPSKVFLEKGKVAFSAGGVFGPGGEGHIRVNMGTSPEILTEALRRASLAI